MSGTNLKRFFQVAAISGQLLLLSVSCALQPSQPHPERHNALSTLRFAIFDKDFLLASEESLELRIEIHPVRNDEVGEAEGPPRIFRIGKDAPSELSLTEVRLGLKEFRFKLLNADKFDVGSATFRHLVKPGKDMMNEPIVIKLHAPQIPRVPMAIDMMFMLADEQQQQQTIYFDIRPILDRHCGSCHSNQISPNDPEPKGGLILSEFPFTSKTFTEQYKILEDCLKWMVALDYPMPPPPLPRVPEAEIAKLRLWLNDGMRRFPEGQDQLGDIIYALKVSSHNPSYSDHVEQEFVGSGMGIFKGLMEGLGENLTYKFKIAVLSKDRKEIFQMEREKVINPPAKWQEKIVIPKSASELGFRIEIRRP